jgi:stage III sporulation protein AH
MIDAALAEISEIASVSIKEAELEDLIKAKGFADCVVYISDEGVNVTVPAPEEGLSSASVAKITDVVTTQTDYTAGDIKIIPVK